jgi:hypothetical protein
VLITKVKKSECRLGGYGFMISECTREEWVEYKNKKKLFPAGLYQIGRKTIYFLKGSKALLLIQ